MAKKKSTVENIAALAELERIGWKYEPVGDDEVKILCPVHEDKDPSATLNVTSNLWNCKACKVKGDFITFLAHALKSDRQTIIVELSSRYDLETIKEISPDVIEKHHAKIGDAGPLLQALRDRGVSDKAIRKFRIGYHDGRLTIPIQDAKGRYVNLRKYLPGAPRSKKVTNARGYGKERLFNVSALLKKGTEKVLILGGEIKLVVADELVGDIFACVSGTGGEGSWDNKWTQAFAGKDVWVLMDIDAAGRAATRKLCSYLAPSARSVYCVYIPLDKEKHPKGDINDWVGAEGATRADLLRVLESAELYEPAALASVVEKGDKDVILSKVANPENVGWRLSVEGVITASDTTPYLIPREINVSCSRDQSGCHKCPVNFTTADEHGFVSMGLSSSGSAILEMVDAGKERQEQALKDALLIPRCKVVEFVVTSHFSVSDVRLTPQLTINGEGTGNVQQPALVVDGFPELNVPYLFKGKVYPHPRSQQATLVLDSSEETADSLSSFNPGEDELDALRIFQPENAKLSKLEAKLDEIYSDLSANVTGIHGRNDMHCLIDMAYHSPLFFKMRGKTVNGWLNVLIVGDSAQGKSETTQRLIDHYILGERVDLKNATVAGLLGGLQQLGNRWFVSWGVIPTHDRRLVILEEMKGAPVEVIGKLTDMRSSGIAEIPKIERRRAHARTRLIALSNPRGSRPMSGFSFGIEAIHDLVGALEDVRRFDAALIVAADDVSHKVMTSRPVVTHVYTSALCRKLILWAWTRTEDQVIISRETEEVIEKAGASLCRKYTEEIPLIDRGTAKHKVARMAAAIAARTFSTTTGHDLVVLPQHVAYAEKFLTTQYSTPKFGYDAFTRARRALATMNAPGDVEDFLRAVRHPSDFVSGMLHCEDLRLSDIQDLCGVDRDAAGATLSFLVRHRALRRGSRTGYSKTPQFITMLRKLDVCTDLTLQPEDMNDDAM